MKTGKNFFKRTNRFSKWNVLTFGASELFSHEKWLRQEFLDLATAKFAPRGGAGVPLGGGAGAASGGGGGGLEGATINLKDTAQALRDAIKSFLGVTKSLAESISEIRQTVQKTRAEILNAPVPSFVTSTSLIMITQMMIVRVCATFHSTRTTICKANI